MYRVIVNYSTRATPTDRGVYPTLPSALAVAGANLEQLIDLNDAGSVVVTNVRDEEPWARFIAFPDRQ